jgi:hypothetical protein
MNAYTKNTLLHEWPKSGFFTFFRHAAALALTLIICSLPVVLQAQVESDDFNDGEDTFPIAWTHDDPLADPSLGGAQHLTVSFPGGNTYKLAAAGRDSSFPATVGPGRGGSLAAVDRTAFYSSVDVVGWTTTLNSAFGLLDRIQNPGLGTTIGYAFAYTSDDHDVQISRVDNENPILVPGTLKSITLDPNKQYRFVFQGKGDSLEGRIYDLADLTTPLIVVQGKDATYDHGVSGLVVYDNGDGLGGADATFDNFVASGAPSLLVCNNPVVASDNFNDGNDNGWTRYMNPPLLNQTFSVVNSAYRLTSDFGLDIDHIGRVASFLMGGPTVSDFNVSVDLVDWDNAQSQQMGVMARVQSPIPTPSSPSSPDIPAGYALVYVNRFSSGSGGTDQMRIFKMGPAQADFISGTGSPAIGNLGQFGKVAGGSPPPTPANPNHYRLVFKGIGNLLMGQIIDLSTGIAMTFNDNNGQLTNTVWANDYKVGTAPPLNPLYTEGHFGVITFQNNAGAPNATFDNICATAAQPPVSITPNGTSVDISWSANQQGIWVLDSSPDLAPTPVWTEIPFSALTFSAGRLIYSVPTTTTGFFRLRNVF